MKKSLKVLSTSLLLATLVVSGCGKDLKNVAKIENSEEALLNNLSDEASSYTLNDIYKGLMSASNGNEVIANKLVNFVGEKIFDLNNSNDAWAKRYNRLVKEKFDAKLEESKRNNKFDEALFAAALQTEGYVVKTPSTYAKDVKSVDITNYSDYVEKTIKREVLEVLLKERYVFEEVLKYKDGVSEETSLVANRKIREVETIILPDTLDTTFKDEIVVRDFMFEIKNKIANNEKVSFFISEDSTNSVEALLKGKMEKFYQDEYDKIGTEKDNTREIEGKYTNGYKNSASDGLNERLDSIDTSAYVKKVMIDSSSTNEVVNDLITSMIKEIESYDETDLARRATKVVESDGTVHYYVVSPNASSGEVNASDVLVTNVRDSKYTYSITRFKIVDTTFVDEDGIFESVKMIASNTSLASNAISHYLEKYKNDINVYDDDVYESLKTLYPSVFTK